MSGSLVPLHLVSLFLLLVGGEITSSSPSKALDQQENNNISNVANNAPYWIVQKEEEGWRERLLHLHLEKHHL